jgi:glycopeptide antibiotics resistance protein
MTRDMSLRHADGTRWLLAAYLLVLGLLVFLPFGRGMDLGDRLNLEPFATIDRALELGPRSPSFRLMIGNIAAFVPLGILLPMVFRSRWSFALVVVGAVGLSAAIELGQLAISVWLGFAYRSTDIDDVILNSLGAVVGYVAFAAISLVGVLRPSR